MVEPVTLTATATAIATIIFNKALEKGGENLGDVVSQKIGQLVHLIREKFKAEGIEGKLTKAQEDPNEKNKSRFEQELAQQMEDDETFANKLKELIEELKSDKQVEQMFFKGVKTAGRAEIGDVEQETQREGSVRQEAITESDIGGDLKVGNIKQRS
jgi:hypothetical protein